MKDCLHGSAKGTINAFIIGHSKKGNYSLVLTHRAMIISEHQYIILNKEIIAIKCQMVKK